MPNVDDRIVRIEFDNSGFERKISDTLDSLADLNQALQFNGAQQGLVDLSTTVGNFGANTSNIAEAVSNISDKFTTLGVIGFTAIQNITNAAIEMVKKIGGDILEPIITGGTQRAKNIEQAKFMFEGLGIDVQAGMASALAAVQGTAFGLDEAAKAAAQFGASGIKVGDQMTAALRGVAGAAAMTGSSFTEMADIFAGSAGSGKVNNMDLMQFATRGLNAAAAIAPILGKTEKQIHEMAAAGTLDFQTFADAMDKAFGQHATEANKTYTGSLANLHAAMSRLGAALIGPQLTQQRDLFNVLTPAVDKFTAGIKPLIDTFTLLSGFAKQGLMEKLFGFNLFPSTTMFAVVMNIQTAMVNIYNAIKSIVEIGKSAFDNIFPPGSLHIFESIAYAINVITEALVVGYGGASKLQDIFQSFFAILSIGWEIIKQGALFIGDLVKQFLALISPGTTDFFSKLSDNLTSFQQALVSGGGIKKFFEGLTNILNNVVGALGHVIDLVHDFFSGNLDDAVGRVSDRFGGLEGVFQRLGQLWGPLENGLRGIVDILGTVFDVVSAWFRDLGHKISEAMGNGNFQPVFDVINSALLGGIVVLLHNFFTDGLKLSIGGDFFQRLNFMMSQVSGILGQVTDSFKAMQTKLKADTLLKIAEAIGILTASVLVLSLINSDNLAKALSAMAVGFGELMATFKIFTGIIDDPKSAASFTILAVGLNLLAGAIFGLSLSVALLGSMDWDSLIKGLTGVTVLLGVLVLASKPLAQNSSGMIQAGLGVTALAVGLGILAVAMKIFATMSWEEMAKGFVGVVGSLVAIALTMKLMPNAGEMLLISVGLIAVGYAMNILAVALKLFATMSWEQIGKGLVAMAGGLALIAAAMYGMPPTLPITAAGLILVGIALNEMAVALKLFATMSWEEIAKSLVVLAGSLIILAVGLSAMSGTILGSISLIIAAEALVVFAAALKLFSSMSWSDLAQGMLKVALALGAFALISVILLEAVPAMLALGAALVVLGVGFALIGAGAYLVAKAFETFAKAGSAGIQMVQDLLGTITETMPRLAEALAKSIVGMLQVFIDAAPVFAEGIGKLLNILVDQLTLLAPKLFDLIGVLIDGIVRIVNEKAQPIIQAVIRVIVKLLEAIKNHIGHIVDVVVDIVVNFVNALADKLDEVVEAVVNLWVTWMTDVAYAIGKAIPDVTIGMAKAFIKGFIDGLNEQVPGLGDWFRQLPGNIVTWIGDVLTTLVNKGRDLITGLLKGLGDAVIGVVIWFVQLPGNILGWIGNLGDLLLNIGADIISGLWRGIQFAWGLVSGFFSTLMHTIRDLVPDPLGILLHIGEKIINGLKTGMENAWEAVKNWVIDKANWIADKFAAVLDIFSPSRVMMRIGEYTIDGFHIGLQNSWVGVDKWVDNASESIVTDMGKIISSISDILDNTEEFKPTITPVLDLTQVQKDSAKIAGYISESSTLAPAVSLGLAQAIATQQIDTGDNTSTPQGGDVNFTQTINAPDRLSARDIYKATRNQLTVAREELSIP